MKAVQLAGKGAVAGAGLFDVDRGESLSKAKKSLAWRILLRLDSKTMDDNDAQKFLARFERLLEPLGAQLRR